MRLLIRTRNQAVGVEGGLITPADGRFDKVIDLPEGEIRPGLINAHDHLHRNHYGRLGSGPYANAHDWAHDIQSRHPRHIAEARRLPRRAALLQGAWKNLFAGVTTVVHHDPWEPDFDRAFPLRVARVDCADSLGMTPDLAGVSPHRPFCLHVAEGVDMAAADEVRTLDARGLLTAELMAVHGVGIDADGVERFRAATAGLIWCPTSNLFLFGRTAPATLLDRGTDLMLGSDSRLTSEGDLLDELRCANALGLADGIRLEEAVSVTAARRLGLAPPSLQPGSVADLIVMTAPLLAARAEDVAVVIAGGAIRVLRPDLANGLGPLTANGRSMTIGRVVRWTNTGACTARSGRVNI